MVVVGSSDSAAVLRSIPLLTKKATDRRALRTTCTQSVYLISSAVVLGAGTADGLVLWTMALRLLPSTRIGPHLHQEKLYALHTPI